MGVEPTTTSLEGCEPSAEAPDNTTTYDAAASAPSNTPSSNTQIGPLSADLQELIDAWPDLPEPIKAAIVAMVDSVTQPTKEPKGRSPQGDAGKC